MRFSIEGGVLYFWHPRGCEWDWGGGGRSGGGGVVGRDGRGCGWGGGGEARGVWVGRVLGGWGNLGALGSARRYTYTARGDRTQNL